MQRATSNPRGVVPGAATQAHAVQLVCVVQHPWQALDDQALLLQQAVADETGLAPPHLGRLLPPRGGWRVRQGITPVRNS